MNTTNCDFCEAEFDLSERRVVATPRPSDPTELVATMWACPACGEEHGLPKAADLHDAVVNGQPVDGRRFTFVSV